MRAFLASSIGVTCAAALALPLAARRAGRARDRAPPRGRAPRVAPPRSPAAPSRCRSRPLDRRRGRSARAPAAGQGLPRRDVRPFSLVGVVWDDPAAELHGRVQVRTRAAGTGAWSGWQDLETHNDDHARRPRHRRARRRTVARRHRPAVGGRLRRRRGPRACRGTRRRPPVADRPPSAARAAPGTRRPRRRPAPPRPTADSRTARRPPPRPHPTPAATRDPGARRCRQHAPRRAARHPTACRGPQPPRAGEATRQPPGRSPTPDPQATPDAGTARAPPSDRRPAASRTSAPRPSIVTRARLGRRREAARERLPLHDDGEGRLRAPHGVGQQLHLRRRRPPSCAASTATTCRAGLARHRLQLPRRQVRQHLRGPRRGRGQAGHWARTRSASTPTAWASPSSAPSPPPKPPAAAVKAVARAHRVEARPLRSATRQRHDLPDVRRRQPLREGQKRQAERDLRPPRRLRHRVPGTSASTASSARSARQPPATRAADGWPDGRTAGGDPITAVREPHAARSRVAAPSAYTGRPKDSSAGPEQEAETTR